MDKALSDSDIAPYVKHIVRYSELKNITARQLIKMIPVAILYQQTPYFGHWTLLLKTPEGVEFFDSYGIKPDNEFKELTWQQPHYLAKKLLEIQRLIPINYNQYQLQSRKEGVNTCGRWIIMRSILDYVGTNNFYRIIKYYSKLRGLTPDELVTSLNFSSLIR